MAYSASHRLPADAGRAPRGESDGLAFLKFLALLAGIGVGVLIPLAIWLAVSAQNASDNAQKAAAKVAAGATTAAMPGMGSTTASAAGGAYATPSFAQIAPANADALAMAHHAVPAELPAAAPGAVAHVTLSLSHDVVSIAPGIRYDAWTFGGTAPGPAIHVLQGQTVEVTLKNDSPMPHSVDFHAAQVAPNVDFADVMPGATKTFSFVASTPGVFMYHCGTAPAYMHIANGMYGAIVVEPKGLPHADEQYVLVASEWYLNSAGEKQPASLDTTKMTNMTPDWVTWNGYAHQYKEHPLTANPGDTVRFWVVDAGPNLNTDFHVVGTVFERAWLNGDLVDAPEHDIQTAAVPAGGGGVFDVKIDHAGIYPFVNHSFASVAMGEVGLLNVGGVPGTMNH